MKTTKDLRVAVVGSTGRMGKFACDLVERAQGFSLVARLTSADDLEAALRTAPPDVALDVTRAGLGYEHAARMIALGIRPLVGTSGVGLDETRALDEAARARGIGGLVVPNFSLGMCLLQRAAVEAARAFAHAEIIEMHHERKKDAPSGTALDTAERMRAARGDDSGASNTEVPTHSLPIHSVPIHSVRLPGLYAHQVVVFGAAGETYTLRHDMSGPEVFGPGILLGLRYAATAIGVGRGIALAFDAAERARDPDARS